MGLRTYLLLIALSITLKQVAVKSVTVNYGLPILAVNIFNALEENSQNKLISPSSIQNNLGVAFAASNSETNNQLLAAFNGGYIGNPNTTMQKVGLLRRGVRSYYLHDIYKTMPNSLLNITSKYLGTPIQPKGFSGPSVVQRLDTFLESSTKKKIKNVVTEEDIVKNINVIFLHSLYYRIEWQDRLSKTSKSDFWNGTHSYKANMLTLDPAYLLTGKIRDSNALALFLPFKESGAGMLVLMPEDRNGLTTLVKKLKQVDISELLIQLKMNLVNLVMPSFEVKAQGSLKGPLTKINVVDAFSKEKADFTGLLEPDGGNSYLRDFKQSTYLKVTNKEVEVAAGTCMLWYANSRPKNNKPIVVGGIDEPTGEHFSPIEKVAGLSGPVTLDRPFFFAILRQKNILFEGTVINV